MKPVRAALLASALALAACQATQPLPPGAMTSPPPAPPAAPDPSAQRNAELAAFFEAYDKAALDLEPMDKAYRGIKDADYGKLDDNSDAAAVALRAFDRQWSTDLATKFDRSSLSPGDTLSYDLFRYMVDRRERFFGFRQNDYVFDQMYGAQSAIPSFLINIHKVESEADAIAYVERIRASKTFLDQAVDRATAAERQGVLPPAWVFDHVLDDSRNILNGAPFNKGADTDLFADFKGKVTKLDIPQARKDALIADAAKAMVEQMKPGYERVIAMAEAQQKRAGKDDGVWRLPNGDAYYRMLLGYYTTTSLTPEEVHQLGLAQVARIHGEMDQIRQRVGFKGTLQQFFAHLRDSDQFYFSNDSAGKQKYLDESLKAQAMVQAALPRFFGVLPKGPLLIKPVEAFRERSAGKAFYQDPPPDGSRPGIYYVNLYNMRAMPSTEVDALFCHEGIPGHHLQGALLAELPEGSIPPFRQFNGYTATDEGWGLYAEKLCKEMGLYQDPYRDFGRLQLELHRAIRLVVDSGIHYKRWSREQAIKYVEDNSADAKAGIPKAIERYIVYPGQATSYMVGKLKIEELRAKAKQRLGTKYNDRAFHDTILLAGSMPLDLLEQRVDAWIRTYS